MSWNMESVLEHRVEAAGHRTRALEVAGSGPGIVLLHGWSDSADTWRPLLAQLGSRGRRAIAVDLPGFGEATRLHDGAVLMSGTPDEVVRDDNVRRVYLGDSFRI